MSYLLDTNVVSEFPKGERAHPEVRRWLASVPDDDLWVSALVLGELRHGVEQLRGRDLPRALRLESWLTEISSASPTGRCP